MKNIIDAVGGITATLTDAEVKDANKHLKYQAMVEEIRKELNFTSLQFQRLDDMVESIGISPCKLCTYCWNGKE